MQKIKQNKKYQNTKIYNNSKNQKCKNYKKIT